MTMTQSIEDKLRNGFYDVKIQQERPSNYICPCGTSFGTNPNKIPNFCSSCGIPVKEPFEKEYNRVQESHKEYKKLERELEEQFKKDVFEYCGLQNHPKKENMFSFAKRHTPNRSELLDMLEELAEFSTSK